MPVIELLYFELLVALREHAPPEEDAEPIDALEPTPPYEPAPPSHRDRLHKMRSVLRLFGAGVTARH